MEPEFWLERWRENQIGFHLPDVNPRLVQHVDALPSQPGQRVFVPLCGKTNDMAWLAARGLHVVGVELSELAAQAFFAERQWHPQVSQVGAFVRYAAHDVEILCGDFFALDVAAVGVLDGVYDRAALVALPPTMREAYVTKLATLLPKGARELLVVFDYDQAHMQGPPFSVPDAEVLRLFAPSFEVRHTARHDILDDEPRFAERGLTQLHEAIYSITRR